MADSQDETDSVLDPTDDGQLTIRIPNPKVYLARQSMWIGRRGKPRCDHCRTRNLKCDRVLPACNHCSWATGRECKYTPLPTPAHRGIPRCDRCRLRNLKCDRNLPVCNHCTAEKEMECNYTPKKRHKVPLDHGAMKEDSLSGPYGTKTASFLVSDAPGTDDQDMDNSNDNADYAYHRHSFYGQNIASTSSRMPDSPKLYYREGSFGPEIPRYPQEDRFTPDREDRELARRSPLPNIPKDCSPANRLSFISHSFPHEREIPAVSKLHLEPWSHPDFAPLPEKVLRFLNSTSLTEMPNRSAFDESLSTFLAELDPELQETATFTPEAYIAVSGCIAGDDSSSKVSERLRMWISYHHVCSGSNKYSLLLVPRDDFFQVDLGEEEKLRADYVTRTDEKAGFMNVVTPRGRHKGLMDGDVDGTCAFERLPVQPQIYDILVYAHRTHDSPFSMLTETRRLGVATITWPMAEMFVRLCPLCNLRNRQGHDQSPVGEVLIPNLVSPRGVIQTGR